MQRRGISRSPEGAGDRPPKKKFKSDPIGFCHIDIAEAQTAEGKLYLFVAIDRTSKFAFVQWAESASRVTASAFLIALIAAASYKIQTILTDNGIERRFTKINHPLINGRVKRMNSTIKEAPVKRYHDDSPDQLRRYLADFVDAYNFGEG